MNNPLQFLKLSDTRENLLLFINLSSIDLYIVIVGKICFRCYQFVRNKVSTIGRRQFVNFHFDWENVLMQDFMWVTLISTLVSDRCSTRLPEPIMDFKRAQVRISRRGSCSRRLSLSSSPEICPLQINGRRPINIDLLDPYLLQNDVQRPRAQHKIQK